MKLEPFSVLVLDLETTGLDLDHDLILEVGAIRADFQSDGNCYILDAFQWTFPLTAAALLRLNAPGVVDMHLASGLIADAANSHNDVTLEAAEDRLLSMFADDEPIMLAGSEVAAFDIHLLRRWMPALAARVGYAAFDVGHCRRLFWAATGRNLTPANSAKKHRALAVARCHLDEFTAFVDYFRENEDR